MQKKHRVRLRGDPADVLDPDFLCDSLCAEHMEIAGDDTDPDGDLLIGRNQISGLGHEVFDPVSAFYLPLIDQELAVHQIFVGALRLFLLQHLILRPAALS